MRPLSSADIATLKPSPSAPSIASAVTRTPSSESSAVSCARRPSFPFIGLASNPSASVGTRNALIPLGPSPPVRANTIAVDAHEPSVMKTFDPVSIQPSPSRSARRERRRVGAAPGLGQRVAAEPLAAREPGSSSCF